MFSPLLAFGKVTLHRLRFVIVVKPDHFAEDEKDDLQDGVVVEELDQQVFERLHLHRRVSLLACATSFSHDSATVASLCVSSSLFLASKNTFEFERVRTVRSSYVIETRSLI